MICRCLQKIPVQKTRTFFTLVAMKESDSVTTTFKMEHVPKKRLVQLRSRGRGLPVEGGCRPPSVFPEPLVRGKSARNNRSTSIYNPKHNVFVHMYVVVRLSQALYSCRDRFVSRSARWPGSRRVRVSQALVPCACSRVIITRGCCVAPERAPERCCVEQNGDPIGQSGYK